MTGRLSQKIYCEATSKQSGKRCRAKGYFTPTSRRFLCRFHRGSKSTDTKTRKYKGLFKNNNVSIDNKIKLLKNLKNFRDKTDDEIKRYILEEQQRSSRFGYRTKYYTRHYRRWKRSFAPSNKKYIGDQLSEMADILRKKSQDKSGV